MKQLDVDVSPPASIMSLNQDMTMTMTPATILIENESLSSDFWSSHFWSSDRRKAMHKSPPCINTGGLQN